MVRSFQNEEEWLRVYPCNESPDDADSFAEIKPDEEHMSEDDATVSDTEERSSHLALGEDEIDEKMLIDGMKFECVSVLIV